MVKSLDIKVAYLQGKEIERVVDLKPPKEANTTGLWKLKKTVYGLKDTAIAGYRGVVMVIQELEGMRSRLEDTVFFWYDKKGLKGVMGSHVDNFFLWGKIEF